MPKSRKPTRKKIAAVKPAPIAAPLPLPAAPKKKILICIPCGKGEPSSSTMVSCANAAREAGQLGWETMLFLRTRDSILVRARDALMSVFWESDCTDMLFVDDDISWEPGAFARLMSHEVELVGGVYFSRGEPMHPVVAPLNGILDLHPSGLVEVQGLGAGFMRISRAGVRRMIDTLPPDHWYTDPKTPGVKIWHLFDFTFDGSQDPGMRLRSEDYVFCDRFRAAGGTVWADAEIMMHHSGQQTWSGRFGDFLRSGGGGAVTRDPGNPSAFVPTQGPALDRAASLVDLVKAAVA